VPACAPPALAPHTRFPPGKPPPRVPNSGRFGGDGYLTGNPNNLAGGTTRALLGDRLSVSGNVTNTGVISLVNGGMIEAQGTLTNAATGFHRPLNTNTEGVYAFNAVPNGT